MAIEFRPLRADEIECRIGQISKTGNGLSLLLYKNSRTDCDILDEVLGVENWQCKHELINGELFCTVSIWDEKKSQWIAKQDVGSPSNVEAEKGRASDSFKRACFKLGIGRELYTAPRIWISSNSCTIKQMGNRYVCYDSFSVDKIDILNREIVYVSIRNDSTGRVVYTWAKQEYQAEPQTNNQPANAPTREMLEEMSGLVAELAKARNVDNDTVLKGVLGSKAAKDSGIRNGEIKTSRQAMAVIGQLKAWLRKG